MASPTDDVSSPVLAAATEAEKHMLRTAKLTRPATKEEVDSWMQVSAPHMSDKAKTTFLGMSAEQQFRIIVEGPLTDCHDSLEILYARVQRSMAMEQQLKRLANASAKRQEKPKAKPASELAIAVGKALVAAEGTYEVVSDKESRFAPPAGSPTATKETSTGPLVGKVKGVGGVIEALAKKYNMTKGERARVLSETKELYRLEGDRNVPKTHCNTGWKWVLEGISDVAKAAPATKNGGTTGGSGDKAQPPAKASEKPKVAERSRSRKNKKKKKGGSSSSSSSQPARRKKKDKEKERDRSQSRSQDAKKERRKENKESEHGKGKKRRKREETSSSPDQNSSRSRSESAQDKKPRKSSSRRRKSRDDSDESGRGRKKQASKTKAKSKKSISRSKSGSSERPHSKKNRGTRSRDRSEKRSRKKR